GVMLLTRRQPDSPATALNKFCSICTPNGVYTEFGIDPLEKYTVKIVRLLEGFSASFSKWEAVLLRNMLH
ncbi:hypothetical protein, partial [Flintibacter porci]|uniref:hypothetical protein n=1 Tax=Flintibacter porci TaxID=3342383 RepID=UPI003F8A5A2A